MSVDCSRLFELIWPTSPLDLGLGRIHPPWRWKVGLESQNSAFLRSDRRGWHLRAHTRQEAWPRKPAKGQQKQPGRASKSAQLFFFSADAKALAQGVCTSGYQKEPLNKTLCVRTQQRHQH